MPDPALTAAANPYDPALRPKVWYPHDASLFNGKFYAYFGPAPAVLASPSGVVISQIYGAGGNEELVQPRRRDRRLSDDHAVLGERVRHRVRDRGRRPGQSTSTGMSISSGERSTLVWFFKAQALLSR